MPGLQAACRRAGVRGEHGLFGSDAHLNPDPLNPTIAVPGAGSARRRSG